MYSIQIHTKYVCTVSIYALHSWLPRSPTTIEIRQRKYWRGGTHCHASLLDLPLTRVLQTKTVFFVGGSVAEVGAKPTAARAWLSPRCRLTYLMRKHWGCFVAWEPSIIDSCPVFFATLSGHQVQGVAGELIEVENQNQIVVVIRMRTSIFGAAALGLLLGLPAGLGLAFLAWEWVDTKL